MKIVNKDMIRRFSNFLSEEGEMSVPEMEKTIHSKYVEFNHSLFGGELPENVPISFAKLSRVGAEVRAKVKPDGYDNYNLVPGSLKLIFSTLYKRNLESILVHEMIHIWFIVSGKGMEQHGIKFLAKLRDIQKKVKFKIPLKDSGDAPTVLDPAHAKAKRTGAILFFLDNHPVAYVLYNPSRIDLKDAVFWANSHSEDWELWIGDSTMWTRQKVYNKLSKFTDRYKVSAEVDAWILREMRKKGDKAGLSQLFSR